jgi:hypothetical protein
MTSTALDTAHAQPVASPLRLVRVQFQTGVARWASQPGEWVYGGETYRAVDPVFGIILSMGEISTGVDAGTATMDLTVAATADLMGALRTAANARAPFRVIQTAADLATGAAIATDADALTGFLQGEHTLTHEAAGTTASITLVSARDRRAEPAEGLNWDAATQALLVGTGVTDLGFEFAASVPDTLPWGQSAAPLSSPIQTPLPPTGFPSFNPGDFSPDYFDFRF